MARLTSRVHEPVISPSASSAARTENPHRGRVPQAVREQVPPGRPRRLRRPVGWPETGWISPTLEEKAGHAHAGGLPPTPPRSRQRHPHSLL